MDSTDIIAATAAVAVHAAVVHPTVTQLQVTYTVASLVVVEGEPRERVGQSRTPPTTSLPPPPMQTPPSPAGARVTDEGPTQPSTPPPSLGNSIPRQHLIRQTQRAAAFAL